MRKIALTRNWATLAVVAMVTPLSVSIPEDDGVHRTTITLAGGAGSHGHELDVYLDTVNSSGYGCDGSAYSSSHEIRTNVDLEEKFTDIGGGIDHQVGNSKLHLGVRGGYVFEQASVPGRMPTNPQTGLPIDINPATSSYANTSYGYVNPYLAIEGHKMGIGVGLVASQVPLRTQATTRVPEDLNSSESGAQPSFHLRFGPRDKFYCAYRLWEGIPIYSGGGMHNVGIGFALGKRADVWAAYASGGPYRTDALFLQTVIHPNSSVGFNFSLRVPKDLQTAQADGTISELGGSIGLVFSK